MRRSHLLNFLALLALAFLSIPAQAGNVIDGYIYAAGGGPSCGATPLIVDGQSYTSSTTLCVPQDVTVLKIEGWGAGSAGTGRTTAGGGGGGGGGAKATRTAKSVTYGDTIAITVGAANTAGTGIPTGTAGSTTFDGCTANGGASPTGTSGITGGAAGTASGCDTNQSATAGSNGGNTSGNNGGAGGAGGTTGGGAGGGAQATANTAGNAGTAPGGGGGGSKRTTTGSPIGGAGSAGRVVFTFDKTPNSFVFTDQTGVTASTQTSSDIKQITGLGAPTAVTISGSGSPEFQICSDSSCASVVVSWGSSSQTIYNNQYLQLRLTANASAGGINAATATVGTGSDSWSVQTFGTPSGTVIEDFEGTPLVSDLTWSKTLSAVGAGPQTLTVSSTTSNVTEGTKTWRLQGSAAGGNFVGLEADFIDLSAYASISIDTFTTTIPAAGGLTFYIDDGLFSHPVQAIGTTGATGAQTLTIDLADAASSGLDLSAVFILIVGSSPSGSTVDYYVDNLIASP